MAPLALACFCDACLLVDFGDLSPMMFIFRLMVYSPAALPVSPKGTLSYLFVAGLQTSEREFIVGITLPTWLSRGEQTRTDSVVSKAGHFCASRCCGSSPRPAPEGARAEPGPAEGQGWGG